MKLDNHIIPFQLGGNRVRGSIVRLGTAVSEIIKRHNYPKNIESLLADTLTITACLGSRMKHDGVFTIQAKGTGEVHTLFSDVTNNGFLRGYVGFNPDLSILHKDLISLMVSGHITFTLDQGKYSKRYQGIVALEDKSISKSAELYFNNSEQLETKFVVFNNYDSDGSSKEKLFSSGLIMLQKMPNKTDMDEEENIEVWENSLNFLSTLKKEECLSVSLTSRDILFRLFNEVGVTVYDEIVIQDKCRCSKEKVELAIKKLNKDELNDIADEKGNIKVICEFCKMERSFSYV
ncbi:MAG: Hsp33 family molecular chaperone HslO [Alphaproteobacteria bacterium]|nr:Hsp33 family molecular chaperone HslO [Alphaproteobacteria bacterium]MDG2457557.1 Hsp33 family molecular chaperone HslO [Alphaproteobacteria bacterium]|tara:strand:+ start:1153 stop:2025 length:873 start_codon:yes stop_codon:yes gene_type:complete